MKSRKYKEPAMNNKVIKKLMRKWAFELDKENDFDDEIARFLTYLNDELYCDLSDIFGWAEPQACEDAVFEKIGIDINKMRQTRKLIERKLADLDYDIKAVTRFHNSEEISKEEYQKYLELKSKYGNKKIKLF